MSNPDIKPGSRVRSSVGYEGTVSVVCVEQGLARVNWDHFGDGREHTIRLDWLTLIPTEIVSYPPREAP